MYLIKCDPRAKARCPFKPQCCGDDVAYFEPESECDKFNQQVLAPPPTNADRIRAMSDEELAKFLDQIAYARETPWSIPFQKKICNNCPTTTCTVEGYDHPMELNECDFADGECPHGSNITWWLQQPAEEDNNA